ncbi:MAG: TetR/AcrR family transcriptional regulator [Clostridia bacterium]|nr:TetR/AcrR family transcriptional regulator [Clostridia bacterium]
MGTNTELSALKNNAVRQKIIESAFRVFTEKAIDSVKMNEIADVAGIGVATVYRYFSNKSDLVLAVGSWVWGKHISQVAHIDSDSFTARQIFELYLEAFLDLYRNRKDILRFNQFFNVYVSGANLPKESTRTYTETVDTLASRFGVIYKMALKDKTLRTDVSEKEMFSATLHLMLAAVTRYAVGLVYDVGTDPEQELTMLKRMLIREYTPV